MATKQDASVVVTWNYGANTIIEEFAPQSDTIFIDWFGPNQIDITESNGDLVISVPSNDQTITLSNIGLEDLSPSNFTIMDSNTKTKIFDMIPDGTDNNNNSGDGNNDGNNDSNGDGNGNDGPGPDPEYRVVGWFQQAGSLWGPKYQVEEVPAEQLTHLVYAFAIIDENGEMAINPTNDHGDQAALDNFEKLATLKEENPHLKLIMAVGGWSKSENFSSTLNNPEGREHFARSVAEFMKEHPMFDGVDLDWEFPGISGLGNTWSNQDGEYYALAVEEIRRELDKLEVETNREYEISVAVSTGAEKIDKFNLPGIHPHVDFINVMAYDINGTWQNTTDHQAPIFDTDGSANTRDISTAVETYLELGVPAEKLVIGAAMYTRAWGGVDADNAQDALRADSDGKAPGTRSEGVYYYSDLLEKVQDPDSGWKLYFDDEAQVAYAWNQEEKIFSSIETPETIALKSAWAKDLGLGGIQFWSLQHDETGHSESLLKAASDFWLKGMSLQEIANASQLEFEAVFGGDGEVAPFWETSDSGTDTDKVVVTWDWGKEMVYNDFDPGNDVLEFDKNIASSHITIQEIDEDLLITVLNNGGHTLLIEDVQAEDLSLDNLVNQDEGMIQQLHNLGMVDDTII